MGEVEHFLKSEIGVDELPADKTLAELGMDSFDLINMACVAEDWFGIEVDDSLLRPESTVREVTDYLETLV